MGTANVGGMLVGACVVYGVIAACSGRIESRSEQPAYGSGGSGRTDGSAGTGSGGVPGNPRFDSGGLFDAVADAIAESRDATPPDVGTDAPDVVVSDCNRRRPIPGSSLESVYAEALFPGKSMDQLAHVIALVEPAHRSLDVDDSYAHYPAKPWVKDGAVAYPCGNSGDPQNLPKSVRFVLPPG